ncbi:MAG TPA: glycosyltransferase, partial [Gammaproteobacteria bacterium]|nr:glycosyltransferase [Gammaproteobacteria bacterium]
MTKPRKRKKKKVRSTPSPATPSQDQISLLLTYFQAGSLPEAEALATSLTQQFPKHPFGWQVLGVVFMQTGRVKESLAPMQSAVKLSLQDAEAHYNLGCTLTELGRLGEAEASYRQAI